MKRLIFLRGLDPAARLPFRLPALLVFLLALHTSLVGRAQHRVGIFDDHLDIGHPKVKGTAAYDATSQVYSIEGGGSNIWFNRDEFHFLYKKLKGDFLLTADFAFSGDTAHTVGHRKIGWMVRASTDEGSASANACEHIDGLVVLQWRPYNGMFMRDPEEERFYQKKGGQTMQLERIGKKISMWISHPGEPFQFVGSCEMDVLADEVLAGLFICSHDSNTLAQARVWNVRIDKPEKVEANLNPTISHPRGEIDIFGSRLEILDIADGHRRSIYETTTRLRTPRWTSDGKWIRFEEEGSSYTIPREGGSPSPSSSMAPLSSGSSATPTSMHAPQEYVYYNAIIAGTMQVMRARRDGSGEEQLTFDQYNNWFPHVSPDGKWVVFISYPMDIDPNAPPYYKKGMLRLMPLTKPGGPRVIAYLYGGAGTLDAPCWSPESRFITFISNSEPAAH
jgi:hypothetical protein